MEYHNKSNRWVADPNVVTIIVQKYSHNLRITVYGKPNIFDGVKGTLEIKPDRPSFSSFLLSDESQLPYARKVIQHSYDVKK